MRNRGLRQNWRMSRTIQIAKAVILSLTMLLAPVAQADEAGALRQALGLASAKDWTGALTAAQGAGAIGGEVILWQWLRDGQGKLGDYENFLARRPDWPGLALLREKGEVAVARSTDAARVIASGARADIAPLLPLIRPAQP